METLYHYCRSSTFLSIITKKSIRLSSLSLSNDSMEGKVFSDAFSRLAGKDSLDKEAVSLLRRTLCFLEDSVDGLGFCLSEVCDLLSQWRGYASDGQGFCIGFSKDFLETLSENQRLPKNQISRLVLRKVIYDKSEQEDALMPAFNTFKRMAADGELKLPKPATILSETSEEDYEQNKDQYLDKCRILYSEIFQSLDNLFVFKNEAFSEEKEWRLVSFLLKTINDDCSFRASDNRLIPYRAFDLMSLEQQPITEIIIGPKNITPIFLVEKLLKKQGFTDVIIRRSSATYR